MRNYLSRIYAAHPLAHLVGLCLLLLAIPGSVWLWREAAIAPGSTERAIAREGDQTRTALIDWLSTHAAPVWEGNPMASDPLDRMSLRTLLVMEIHLQATGLQGQIAETRRDLFARVDDVHRTVRIGIGAGLSEIDKTRDMLDAHLTVLNHNAEVGIDSATNLMDTYAALPEKFYVSPEWQAIRPQITCRDELDRHQSGCWSERVTALLGESVRVGGVFTQKFPALSDSAVGIAQNFNGLSGIAQRWAAKNVDPHPMTKKEKAAAVAKIVFAIGLAGLRGGAF